MHAPDWNIELLSKSQPSGPCLYIGICIVDGHTLTGVELLPGYLDAFFSSFQQVLVDTFVAKWFQKFPIKCRLACTWTATKHNNILLVTFLKGDWQEIQGSLQILFWLEIADEFVRSLLQKVLFCRFKADANVRSKVPMIMLAENSFEGLSLSRPWKSYAGNSAMANAWDWQVSICKNLPIRAGMVFAALIRLCSPSSIPNIK